MTHLWAALHAIAPAAVQATAAQAGRGPDWESIGIGLAGVLMVISGTMWTAAMKRTRDNETAIGSASNQLVMLLEKAKNADRRIENLERGADAYLATLRDVMQSGARADDEQRARLTRRKSDRRDRDDRPTADDAAPPP